jgi:hypothetical protein
MILPESREIKASSTLKKVRLSSAAAIWFWVFIGIWAFIASVQSAHGEAYAWVDGTPLLRERSVKLALSYGREEKARSNSHILKNELAPPPLLGSSQTFWAFNIAKEEYYQVEATLKAIGEHCYIYVENTNLTRASDKVIDRLRSSFDTRIYPTNSRVFGTPPDVDGDPRIFILVLDVKDNFSGTSQSFVAGYYDSTNQYPNGTQVEDEVLKTSNEAEILYVDLNPADPTSSQVLGTIAHEFQHMIHWNHDPLEDAWLNEGLSDLAIFLNGYGHPDSHVIAFREAPETSLADRFDNGLAEYGAAYLWALYLWEKYGGDTTIGELVSNTGVGKEGIEETLSSLSISATFASIFHDWKVANYLDDTSFDRRYGYESIDLNLYSDLKVVIPDEADGTGVVNGWGSEYLKIIDPAEITLKGDVALNARVISGEASVSDLVWENGTGSIRVDRTDTVLALNLDAPSVSGNELAPQSLYSYSINFEDSDTPPAQPPGDIFGLFGCSLAGSGGGSGLAGPLALGWVGLWGWRIIRRRR